MLAAQPVSASARKVAPSALPAPRRRAPRLAERLIAVLSKQIEDETFKPGSKLPTEHEIMRAHGVSRAVVREAMARLQAAGLVESRQGIGTFVVEAAPGGNFRIDPATIITLRDVLALLELRISFETEAASLAAHRHTPKQLRPIRDALDRNQQDLGAGRDTTKADFDFHLAIAAATGNKYFGEILNHLGLAILPRTRVDLRYIAGDDTHLYLSRCYEEHRRIHEAIARRDADGAQAAMRTHLSNSREHLRELSESGAQVPLKGR